MIGFIDWLIWFAYLLLIFGVMLVYRNTKSEAHYKYFLPGFAIKVVGGLAFALVYMYYYGFGDTFLYHHGATVMSQTFIESPSLYFELMSAKGGEIPAHLDYIAGQVQYSRTYEEWFMVKILSVFNLISFQSYLVTTLLISTLSFVGAWKLFLVFKDLLKARVKYAFWATFLVPSVVFWGSGIMKDTITLFALNYLIYLIYNSVFKRKLKIHYLIISALLGYIIVLLKAYILLAFLPGLFLGLYRLLGQSFQSSVLRFIVSPAIFGLLLVVSYFGLSAVSESSAKYNTSNIEYQVKGFHSWHTDVGGSTYSLGEIEYTPRGVISKIPAGLNVTFFRPYIWEARNPVVFIGALESLAFLVLTVTLLFRTRFRLLKHLKRAPLLYGFFYYCLIFGFAVGFTSYNFGALARYKIPIMSLFTFILLYLNYKTRNVQQASPHKIEPSQSPYGPEKNIALGD